MLLIGCKYKRNYLVAQIFFFEMKLLKANNLGLDDLVDQDIHGYNLENAFANRCEIAGWTIQRPVFVQVKAIKPNDQSWCLNNSAITLLYSISIFK